jgi:putative addiction module component (TIGR02574 family)
MRSESLAVFQAALALPVAEKLKLAEQLIESVPVPELDRSEKEFVAELDRRFAEVEEDPSSCISWTEIEGNQ